MGDITQTWKEKLKKSISFHLKKRTEIKWLLFGVNEKMLTRHISGPVTKYKLLYVSIQGRAGAWAKG